MQQLFTVNHKLELTATISLDFPVQAGQWKHEWKTVNAREALNSDVPSQSEMFDRMSVRRCRTVKGEQAPNIKNYLQCQRTLALHATTLRKRTRRTNATYAGYGVLKRGQPVNGETDGVVRVSGETDEACLAPGPIRNTGTVVRWV